jgi:ABC-type transporter Mla subunit MlaD
VSEENQEHQESLAAKDRRIDDLVLQAEKLVADLNLTVSDMRQILGIAAQQVQEARDEQQRGRREPGGAAGG